MTLAAVRLCRYTMFYGFTPPWMRVWKTEAGSSGPSAEGVAEAEGELKEILSRSHNYTGQYDALEGKLEAKL